MKTPNPAMLFLLLPLLAMSCSSTSSDPVDVQGDSSADAVVEVLDAREVTAPNADVAFDTPDPDVCQPQCEERECGPDGCGGNCGTCGGLQVCLDYVCCSQECEGKDCGPDGCGGSCGSCGGGEVCLDGVCCLKQCEGKNCGPDGCGSSCGACQGVEFCMDGICSAPDKDYDGIPDDADLFPENGGLPGVALPDTVYAHTSGTLYSMDVKMYKLEEVADFDWPDDGATHKMTDIGIDRYGVLYGTSYEYLYTCHPQTGVCHLVAKLPSAFNGLTLIPAALMDSDRDVLVGISEEGGWYQLDVVDGELEAVQLGSYGAGYSSAGDAYSIEGVGTFAAVHKQGVNDNVLVSVDPVTGKVLDDVGVITGYVGIFGLAGWTGKAFAFDKTGDVLVIDTATTEVSVLHESGISWWGAGVATTL